MLPWKNYKFTMNVSFYFSRFLGNIKEAFDKDSNLTNLLLDDFFKKAITDCQVNDTMCVGP